MEVGYNVQATADAEHNLVVDVYAGGVNDLNELSTAGRRAQEISGVKKIDFLADAGYHNGTQLAKCERRGVRPFVAPRQGYAQKEEGFRKSDFKYDKSTDTYICPAGSVMRHTSTFKRKTSKVPYKVKRYTTPDCDGCPLRSQCTTSSNGRYIERPIHQAYTERNDRRVTRYRDFYRRRQEIIEHIFGTWKRHWGMTHAVVKGKEISYARMGFGGLRKVESEYRLAAIAYNLLRAVQIMGLEKLQKQLGKLIFELWRLLWPTWSRYEPRFIVFP
ncbi:MAG: transposase [Bacteroidetes bacterium]|nr:transposase [Bacteroidota bacterium]